MMGSGEALFWRPVRRAMRRIALAAALRLAGGLILLAGLLTLVSAIWLALAAVHGHVVAALAVGGLASLVGLVLLVWPAVRRDAPPSTKRRALPQPTGRDPLLVDGFLIGLAAASALDRKRG